ncbi:hypothetical protein D9O50_00380 [Oxalobacteraceae bacterium CAVE-383]|nr:hypothetical protein D9O50_00380 [Oxalobacteraceae bacterium CAVE-383]
MMLKVVNSITYLFHAYDLPHFAAGKKKDRRSGLFLSPALLLIRTIRRWVLLTLLRCCVAIARSRRIAGFIAGILLILTIRFHLLLRTLAWSIAWLTALLRLSLAALIGLICLI